MSMPQSHYDYLEHPKTCDPEDLWGQVRRTVNGKPISEEQLELIFSMVRTALHFEKADTLLDLACGNGALASYFFDEIHEYLGVDMSPYLIEVAKKNFENTPRYSFLENSINPYSTEEKLPERFTKILLYGAVAYLSKDELRELLTTLRTRFTHVSRFFIGTIPDRDCAKAFFQERPMLPLDDHTTAIGLWWTRHEFQTLCEDCGWTTQLVDMPQDFFQSHYRFNAVLTPKA